MQIKKRPTTLVFCALATIGLLYSGGRVTAEHDGGRFGQNARDGVFAEATQKLMGWGTVVDPEGDCTIFVADEAILIHVPGAARPHGLSAELNTTNAPRVLQTFTGDFTVQVRIDGRFLPGGQSTQPRRTPYNGAGLVAMDGPGNAVTLVHAALRRPASDPQHYANFEVRDGGELQRMGLTTDQPLPEDAPVFLRLERRGDTILGATSTDGHHWDTLPSKQLSDDWPDQLQVGVVAMNNSLEEFNPRFSDLQAVN